MTGALARKNPDDNWAALDREVLDLDFEPFEPDVVLPVQHVGRFVSSRLSVGERERTLMRDLIEDAVLLARRLAHDDRRGNLIPISNHAVYSRFQAETARAWIEHVGPLEADLEPREETPYAGTLVAAISWDFACEAIGLDPQAAREAALDPRASWPPPSRTGLKRKLLSCVS